MTLDTLLIANIPFIIIAALIFACIATINLDDVSEMIWITFLLTILFAVVTTVWLAGLFGIATMLI